MSSVLGFIGLGVMGEPMCRNIATKSGARVLAFDVRAAVLQDVTDSTKNVSAAPIASIAREADMIFMSLPGGPEVCSVCHGTDGLIANGRAGQIIVDLSTIPVKLTRALAAECAAREILYADAPVARTRQAARDGTLSVMVGASAGLFARIEPLLRMIGTEITHCGPVGCGQTVKILNNMVLFQTVVALAEALTVARHAGLDGRVLFETLSKGSGDSFALRNHGMKALLPGTFPHEAFSTTYARKDLACALALAEEAGLALHGAVLADTLLKASEDAGFSAEYFPALVKIIDPARAVYSPVANLGDET